MKNNYLISPNYLLQLENDELRERIKKLISDFKELKKLYDEKNIGAAEGMVQDERENAIIQE
jgi:regulator of replication initiation timing